MSGGNYDALVEVIFFLVMVWVGGRISQFAKLSPILGEIVMGIIFGPQGLDMVPYTKGPHQATGADSHRRLFDPFSYQAPSSVGSGGLRLLAAAGNATTLAADDCSGLGSHSYLSIWQLAGNIGVALMIAESGMHLDFSKVRAVGSKAFGVAILGTFSPILVGMAFIAAFGMDVYPTGVSVGSALAPTSVGIALKLLNEGKHLHSDAGQTVVIAAFVDDIFSLIVLVILVNLSAGSITAWGIISPFLYCFVFLGGSAFLATRVMPYAADVSLHKIPIDPKANYQIRDEVHLILMLGIIAAFGKIGALIGSELLGTFCAGMLFCMVPHSMTVWHHEMTPFCEWLIRLFFAASVAFSVPVSDMFSADGASLLWKGALVALVPCILTKVFSGFFLRWTVLADSKWTVGWAMVGRAEFAFMVAKVAHESFLCGSDDGTGAPKRMLSSEGYIITLWALLVAIVVGPIMFKRVLNQEMVKYRKEHPATIRHLSVVIHGTKAILDHDVVEGVEHVLHEHKLDLEAFDRHADKRIGHDGDDEDVFRVKVGLKRADLMDEEELEMIQHEIEDAINEHDCEVIVTTPREKGEGGQPVAHGDVEAGLANAQDDRERRVSGAGRDRRASGEGRDRRASGDRGRRLSTDRERYNSFTSTRKMYQKPIRQGGVAAR